MRFASSALMAVLVFGPTGFAANEKASYVTTHAADLNPGGRVEIEGSFGELHVTGWDQSRIEIVVKRKTQKEYSAASIARAEEVLRQVDVDINQPTPDHVIIATHFPDRKVTRPMRGKTDLDLSYEVRMPRDTSLSVKHDIGEVRIESITGDLSATCRVGEINVAVPEDVSYSVDAKSRIGTVNADIPEGNGQGDHKLFARVGVGEITIHPAEADSAEDEISPLEVEII